MPRLNVAHPDVRQHLFDAVRMWFDTFWIDGIRFDAVEQLDKDLVREFCAVARDAKPDCWLLGEVLSEDYRAWVGQEMLDSCTNYEVFKGLWSSFNDRNLFEIAWSLNRQFGPDGIYREMPLYTFVDNHDQARVASLLQRREDLSLVYTLLYTVPGVPSVYYGSEWGITGTKEGISDDALRPALVLPDEPASMPEPWLPGHLARLALIRQEHDAIRHGDYTELHVASEQLAFRRQAGDDFAVVVVNAALDEVTLDLEAGPADGWDLVDALDGATRFAAGDGRLVVSMTPGSARVLVPAGS
jgi:glycosidase